MRKKMFLSALCLGAMAVSATETSVVSQSFSTATDDIATHATYKAAWTGYGSVTNFADGGSSYSAPTVGLPTGLAAPGTYLSVDGYVTCTAAVTSASKPATVDMMIQVALPDDELALPTSETTSDIQIAVGVETNGTLKVYCKNKSGTAGWYSLGDTTYAEGTWHRVTFTFDYAQNTCLLSLDGSALMSANGYLTSNPSTAISGNGAWYKLNTTDKTALSSVKVVGSTAIDEVVVKYADNASEVVPAAAGETTYDGVAVDNDWIQKQGISQGMITTNADAPDGSGMKVLDKYVVGLNATDGTKFAVTAMAMSGAAGAVKATLTIPAMTPASGYKNVVKYGTSPSALNSSADITANATSVQLNVDKAASGPTVIYYQLQSVKTSQE